MRDLSQLSELQLKEAHDAANGLLSEKFRSCFSSPVLATLLSKFRDDCLDALGMELPPRLPLRVRRQKLEALTDAELAALASRVETLLGGFAEYVDDPALLAALGNVRADVITERGDRSIVRATFGQRAEAS
jgi:hypothetical protein